MSFYATAEKFRPKILVQQHRWTRKTFILLATFVFDVMKLIFPSPLPGACLSGVTRCRCVAFRFWCVCVFACLRLMEAFSVTRYWNKKVAQFFIKLPQKVTTAVLLKKWWFHSTPKVTFGLLLKDNLSPIWFKIPPNLVTLAALYLGVSE